MNPLTNPGFSPPDDGSTGLERWIDAGLEAEQGRYPRKVFFRADDVGVPGKQFLQLIDLFARYQVPLNLAVVPVWLTEARWLHLKQLTENRKDLWCWHQHGWRHRNNERSGKKQEFGPACSPEQTKTTLMRGRDRLRMLMGDHFYPVFTPPWNRCDLKTLQSLKELDYHAVSRSAGSLPASPAGLPDLVVSVDLHTRKEKNGALRQHHILEELSRGLASGRCGIMIHHQRMDGAAFGFLEDLLKTLVRKKPIELVPFNDLLRETKTFDP